MIPRRCVVRKKAPRRGVAWEERRNPMVGDMGGGGKPLRRLVKREEGVIRPIHGLTLAWNHLTTETGIRCFLRTFAPLVPTSTLVLLQQPLHLAPFTELVHLTFPLCVIRKHPSGTIAGLSYGSARLSLIETMRTVTPEMMEEAEASNPRVSCCC